MASREKSGKHAEKHDRAEAHGGPDGGGGSVGGPLVAMARGLAEIVAEHGLSELILDTKEVTLTVRRGPVASVAAAPVAVQVPAPMPAAVVPPPAELPSAPAPASAPAAVIAGPAPNTDRAHTVTSPFVGTFYRRPNPDSAPYVSLGERIAKGQVLCIIEAMKLMNEIEADAAGTVVAILVDDNQPVEYGQPLFKISP